jgi:hypothetical protein
MVLVYTSQPLSAHGKGASNIFIREWRIVFKDEAATHSGTMVLTNPLFGFTASSKIGVTPSCRE